MATTLHKEPFPLRTVLKSSSGQIYKIEEVLVDRRKPLLCVYRASADKLNFIAKNMIPGEFDYQLNLQKTVASCHNVRTVVDTIRDLDLFIFPFLAGDLLGLSQS
ncbi:hypothetical protein N7535_003743 [Penicillium sp. DV-2018c]|nr:hypothetical protein N7535_003743 [Penicillium sp. DV-2018c]